MAEMSRLRAIVLLQLFIALAGAGALLMLWCSSNTRSTSRLRETSKVSESARPPLAPLASVEEHTGLMLRLVRVEELPGDHDDRPVLTAQIGHDELVTSISYSSDGQYLLTGSSDKSVRLWHAPTGLLLREFSGPMSQVDRVAFLDDGKHFMTVDGGNRSRVVRFWRLRDGKEAFRFVYDDEKGNGRASQVAEDLDGVACSPSGDLLAVALAGSLYVYDFVSGRVLLRLKVEARQIAFSPDSRRMIIGGVDCRTELWELSPTARLQVFPTTCQSLAYSPKGQLIATGKTYTTTLWDSESGQRVRRFRQPIRAGDAVQFSTDGQLVAAVGGNAIAVWSIASGRLVRHTTFPVGLPSDSESPDGLSLRKEKPAYYSSIASACSPDCRSFVLSPPAEGLRGHVGRGLREFDVESGLDKRTLVGRCKQVMTSLLSTDGRWLITGEQNAARIWDLTAGRLVHTFIGHAGWVNSVAISPDGRYLATSNGSRKGVGIVRGNCGVRVWEIETGSEIYQCHGQKDYSINFCPVIAFSPDGRLVSTSDREGTTYVWSATGDSKRFPVAAEGNALAFSKDGRSFAIASDTRVCVRKTDTGSLIRELGYDAPLPMPSEPRRPLLDRHTLHFEFEDDQLRSRPIDGKLQRQLDEEWKRYYEEMDRYFEELDRQRESENTCRKGYCSVDFSPDGKNVVAGADDGKARVFELRTGRLVCAFEGHDGPITTVAVSTDGKLALTASHDKTARLWSMQSGEQLAIFEGHSSPVNSASFYRDGQIVLTSSDDCTSRLWDAETGQELCRLLSFADGTWAVVGSDGRYDSSGGGDVKGLHWVVDDEPIALEQLKERYYEPELLAKYLGFNNEPLRDVTRFESPELFPDLCVTEPTAENTAFAIHLKNRGGGIGPVVVKINGKEVMADARAAHADPDAKEMTLNVNLANDPRIIHGQENLIEVQAFNAEGYLCSRGLEFIYEPPGDFPAPPPEMWAIVAGVSDYRGDEIDLRYAAKDAEDFAVSLQLAAGRLFGADKVQLTLLSTDHDDPSTTPTRDNLVESLEDAQQAKPGDVLVVYLAGHGVNYGGQDGDFYYLTADAWTANLTDPEVRRLTALSSQELTEMIKAIPALKQVMILDTCSAGRLVEKLTETRRVPSSQIRALERLKDRTGMHILAGCAAEAVSYEASQYGQGLLTHSLLLGMRGAALREDEYVDVGKLFAFAADKVPELAKGIGGIQRPELAIPRGGASFDVGRLTSEDKVQVPLKSERPLVLRCYFGNKRRKRDLLGLSKRINDVLRDHSARGHGAPVFVDADEFPGAYQMAGDYAVQDDRVTVAVFVGRGAEDVAEFELAGQTTDLDQLATAIVQKLRESISTQPAP